MLEYWNYVKWIKQFLFDEFSGNKHKPLRKKPKKKEL